MWQHVQLSEQIRPRDTQACGWDVKQPTNKPLRGLRMLGVFLLLVFNHARRERRPYFESVRLDACVIGTRFPLSSKGVAKIGVRTIERMVRTSKPHGSKESRSRDVA